MDMATAKRRMSTSSIVFYDGDAWRIFGLNTLKKTLMLRATDVNMICEAPVKEVTE